MTNHNIKPTEGEMEILQVLWQKGNATVREVHEALNKKDSGYTTTLKLMQILHEKGMVERDTNQKTHIYKALVSQDKTEKQLVNKMIDNVFNGSAARLVMQALGNHSASAEEIDEIKKYLDSLK
ncbi:MULTISPECIES: BlaI/MecI/CopY family transcriptional regulator [Pedobacter]|jgi:BlaI family transcriptional regulator, penicillinase repressor|uniref:BlaI/MecI/CopY family transcriptional regulator n=1 Tax=Pedobacter alluvionis TaxID=475253 RepID=A0A497YB93_9SPHI|nr:MULTISPECIES: BlaI/MecI/CopY family transcriptional regulator [Pedobacter]MBE5322217.1 BlaI/MecI/CopY family transcriptional regulator [Pedobacter sp. MR2016-19]QDW26063.1 BlaI/MecI/CopY family transcriptional regulator [Pedobacter sp. KBS0701]QXU40116.1 BlaI/MecI/CopY family transcriptional regulator [Pedobacter sp. D749]RLJ80919.1 putative transcriptional regulator [Pedobacter alluvionis]TFB34122.1 BlaI/MecI/CopY family transcriptional regulator [Pedobacter alluvionis]